MFIMWELFQKRFHKEELFPNLSNIISSPFLIANKKNTELNVYPAFVFAMFNHQKNKFIIIIKKVPRSYPLNLSSDNKDIFFIICI